MSRFFIRRPIVAIVIAIITVLGGLVAMSGLPISQFPQIVPPQILVTAQYPGADALTIEQAVATPLEQQINGVDDMLYMRSSNANDGTMTLTVTFDVDTVPNIDQVNVQNRMAQAQPNLPPEVSQFGLTMRKQTGLPMVIISLSSPKRSYDALFLANYANINILDALYRVPGVGEARIFGAGDYAMRIWVKPDALARLSLTVPDISNAIRQQSTVNPAGQVGQMPVPAGQEMTYTVRAQGRLQTEKEFGAITVRSNPDGSVIRLSDVARIQLGALNYQQIGRANGEPGCAIAVFQAPGSNALDVAKGVEQVMTELRGRFPADLEYGYTLDTTRAVSEGIREILITLAEAMVLVVFVVYLFLQNWRATLIPTVAVPVSLIGTFAVFPALGFSVNTLSLFGLVLAIGLVVDDAIVVVEAVEHHIEERMSPKEATLKAMEEISGPVIGIALVLSAVFVPTTFIPGITGRLYQQFALTIAIAVIISAFNALSLSPALAALILRPKEKNTGLLQRFFDKFNQIFGRAQEKYVSLSGVLIRKSVVALAMLSIAVLGAGLFSSRLPTSFLPDEDQGYMSMNMQLPYSSSLQRTSAAAKDVEEILRKTPGVKSTVSVLGFSLLSLTRSSYNAFFFVTLNEWKDRTTREQQYQFIKTALNKKLSTLPQGTAFTFSPPAIPGVGTSGGFTFVLEDRAGNDVKFLGDNLGKFLAAVRKRPEIASANTTFLPAVPQQFVVVDREKVLKQGVAINDVYKTIQAFMGGSFINYFNRFGRQWQGYMEAEGDYRNKTENVGLFYVRNNKGEMVPLSALTKFEPRSGPEFTMRYNLYRSAQIIGAAAPGYSSAQAMKALEDTFAETMPPEMGYDYLGISYQEKKAQTGIPASVIFGFSLLFVFLVLAALYESWTLPFSVLLSTPIAVFGAFFVLWLRRIVLGWFAPPYMVQIENDVYSQIGLVMLIGLAAKNAILIVEFAKDKYEQGMPLTEAALEGAKVRLRPILMTSFAFILGCVPLWTATGAGSVARRIMGTTVIGGMLAATLIAVFIIPVLFVLVERFSQRGKAGEHAHVAATRTIAHSEQGDD